MINISRLFHEQQLLDETIAYKLGRSVTDFLPERVLALTVEAAEAANECRCFKFWSTKQGQLKGTEQEMLHELADVLHFALGLGNSLGFDPAGITPAKDGFEIENLVDAFIELTSDINRVGTGLVRGAIVSPKSIRWILEDLLRINRLLGYTEDQLQAAYFEKLEINYRRQREGY